MSEEFHPIHTPTRYIIEAKVVNVFENFRTIKSWKKPNGDVERVEESAGWFVQLSGSYESLYFGLEQPDLEPGDKVQIIIQKVQTGILNALPERTGDNRSQGPLNR